MLNRTSIFFDIHLLYKNMNNKKAKKIRQLYRRDLREKMNEEFNILKKLFRPRPKYVPRFIWKLLFKALLNKKYVEQFYKN